MTFIFISSLLSPSFSASAVVVQSAAKNLHCFHAAKVFFLEIQGVVHFGTCF